MSAISPDGQTDGQRTMTLPAHRAI